MANYKKIRRLKNKADKLWFEVLIKLEPYCEVCGKRASQVHHFIPKSVCSVLRFDLGNGVSLCRGCHTRLHRAADPEIITTIVRKKGEPWLKVLSEIRFNNPTFKFTVGYLEKKIEELEESLLSPLL